MFDDIPFPIVPYSLDLFKGYRKPPWKPMVKTQWFPGALPWALWTLAMARAPSDLLVVVVVVVVVVVFNMFTKLSH